MDQPLAAKCSQTAEPINPEDPVTSNVFAMLLPWMLSLRNGGYDVCKKCSGLVSMAFLINQLSPRSLAFEGGRRSSWMPAPQNDMSTPLFQLFHGKFRDVVNSERLSGPKV